jgi:hypothetical protein
MGKAMSAGSNMDVTCACGHTFAAWVWQSANVTLEPELRKLVLDGKMNVVKCPSCGAVFHVETPFLYHDMIRREWIWVYPLSYGSDAGMVDDDLDAMWDKIGSTMPADVRQALETTYKTMIVFGMDALVNHLKQSEKGPGSDLPGRGAE